MSWITLHQVLRERIARLLDLCAYANLYSQLLDTSTIFWNQHGMHDYYQPISKNLEIANRMHVLNTQLHYSIELLEGIQRELKNQYGFRINWIIITLLFISAVIGIFKGHDNSKICTESLLISRREEEKEEKEASDTNCYTSKYIMNSYTSSFIRIYATASLIGTPQSKKVNGMNAPLVFINSTYSIPNARSMVRSSIRMRLAA